VCPKLVKAFEDFVKLAVVGGGAFEGVAVAEEPGYRESEFAARSSSSRSCRLSSALIFI